MDPPDSNERLCMIFEMVMSRLDSLGAELDKQKRVVQHSDSLRPLGTPFSGLNLCGVEVGLTLHNTFSADGAFDSSNAPVCVFVGTALKLEDYTSVTENGHAWVKKCEPALRAAWDAVKCASALARLAAWDEHPQNRSDILLKDEVLQVYLVHKHPNLLAWNRHGILAHCSDIPQAYRMVTEISRDLECPTGDLEMHVIWPWLEPLALACVEGDESAIKRKWESLSRVTREMIEEGHSFFTRRRLML